MKCPKCGKEISSNEGGLWICNECGTQFRLEVPLPLKALDPDPVFDFSDDSVKKGEAGDPVKEKKKRIDPKRKILRIVLIVIVAMSILSVFLGVLVSSLARKNTYYFEESDSMQKGKWAWVELMMGTWTADTGETGTYTKGDRYIYLTKENEKEHFAYGICEDGVLYLYYYDKDEVHIARTKKAKKRDAA